MLASLTWDAPPCHHGRSVANASPSLTARSIQVPEFSSGTHGIIRAIAAATARGSVTVIGGECHRAVLACG